MRPPILTTSLQISIGGLPQKATIFDAVDKAFQSLPKGAMAFNTPPPMNIDGPPQEVEMRVGMQPPAELAKTISVPGDVEVHDVQIANRMTANLCCDSDGLKITRITPTVQAVSGVAPTIWRWSIKPLKAGLYPVSVELDADVKIDGEDTTRLVDDFHGTINVTITPRQRVVNGGQEARSNGGGRLPYWIETHFLPARESRREANWSALRCVVRSPKGECRRTGRRLAFAQGVTQGYEMG